jgi:hypothetical protein
LGLPAGVVALLLPGWALGLPRQYWRFASLPDLLASSAAAVGAAALFWAVLHGADAWRSPNLAFPAIHALLQRLLGLPTPAYHHHRLIRDDQGKRLAKRDDARALSKYRDEGATPADIRRMVGL